MCRSLTPPEIKRGCTAAALRHVSPAAGKDESRCSKRLQLGSELSRRGLPGAAGHGSPVKGGFWHFPSPPIRSISQQPPPGISSSPRAEQGSAAVPRESRQPAECTAGKALRRAWIWGQGFGRLPRAVPASTVFVLFNETCPRSVARPPVPTWLLSGELKPVSNWWWELVHAGAFPLLFSCLLPVFAALSFFWKAGEIVRSVQQFPKEPLLPRRAD